MGEELSLQFFTDALLAEGWIGGRGWSKQGRSGGGECARGYVVGGPALGVWAKLSRHCT